MLHEIIIPVMDQATETVLLVAWRKQAGEAVQKGEAICEIETEKATVEIEAPGSGVFRQSLAEAGTRIPPRTVIGLIADADEPLPDLERYRPKPAPTTQAPSIKAPPAAGERVLASPRAKRLAEEHHIDLQTVRGTGPEGRIQEEDVRNVMAQASTGRVARAKAERVSQAWHTIPHFYTTLTADLSQVVARKAHANPPITFTDFFALALCQTLTKHPTLNGHWKDDALTVIPEIRLGLVAQTERGLLLPTLSDLRGRSLTDIAAERERVVQKAREGRVDSAQGEPTISLSNIGPGHIDHFTALISPPQVAIVSVGSVQRRPVVVGDELVIRPTATFTLGVDHRAIDGRAAAAFLEDLKTILEAVD
jgi:pyruvate dehydrogenase E2 component (dihydrolipoamide acetyltransferase)